MNSFTDPQLDYYLARFAGERSALTATGAEAIDPAEAFAVHAGPCLPATREGVEQLAAAALEAQIEASDRAAGNDEVAYYLGGNDSPRDGGDIVASAVVSGDPLRAFEALIRARKRAWRRRHLDFTRPRVAPVDDEANRLREQAWQKRERSLFFEVLRKARGGVYDYDPPQPALAESDWPGQPEEMPAWLWSEIRGEDCYWSFADRYVDDERIFSPDGEPGEKQALIDFPHAEHVDHDRRRAEARRIAGQATQIHQACSMSLGLMEQARMLDSWEGFDSSLAWEGVGRWMAEGQFHTGAMPAKRAKLSWADRSPIPADTPRPITGRTKSGKPRPWWGDRMPVLADVEIRPIYPDEPVSLTARPPQPDSERWPFCVEHPDPADEPRSGRWAHPAPATPARLAPFIASRPEPDFPGDASRQGVKDHRLSPEQGEAWRAAVKTMADARRRAHEADLAARSHRPRAIAEKRNS